MFLDIERLNLENVQVALNWLPFVFLILFTTLEIHFIRKSQYRNISWNLRNSTKILVIVLLILLHIYELILKLLVGGIQNEDIILLSVRCLSLLIVSGFIWFNKKYGVRISGIIFTFWLLLQISELPEIFIGFKCYNCSDFISKIAKLILISLEILLSLLIDAEPSISPYEENLKSVSILNANLLSRILFSFLDDLIWKGFKRPLELTDVPPIDPQEKSKFVHKEFRKEWKKSYGRISGNCSSSSSKYTIKNKVSLFQVIRSTFGGRLYLGMMFSFFYTIFELSSPVFLRLIMQFVKSGTNSSHGYFYVFLFFISTFLQSVFDAQHLYFCIMSGFGVKTAVMNAIYRKSIKISNSAKNRSKYSNGEVLNFISTDVQRLFEITPYLHILWQAPVKVCIVTYFLMDLLGIAAFVGILVFVLIISITAFLATKTKTLQNQQMILKDLRLKVTNEVIDAMKIIKLNAWELNFIKKISVTRNRETKVMRKSSILNALIFFCWAISLFLVEIVTFGTFLWMNGGKVLSSEIIFVSIALFNILKFPVMMLPTFVTLLIQCKISLSRIENYLNSEESSVENQTENKDSSLSLEIKHGTFSWDEKFILKDINFKIKKGTFVAVIGPVGSGKTSLLSALFGDMTKHLGIVYRHGKIAYVSQDPWIQKCSLKDNILFGREFDRNFYQRVIIACNLKKDIQSFENLDDTIISEKGINLSRGQMQRISLARAIYGKPDILLLDDPLSSVDSQTHYKIFHQVFGRKGVLKNSTRIMVTNSYKFLSHVDEIFVMKGGQIVEKGGYRMLLQKGVNFSTLLNTKSTDLKEDFKANKLVNSPQALRKSTSGSEKEESVIGSVKMKIYFQYFKYFGTFVISSVIFFNVLIQVFSASSNICLSIWSGQQEITYFFIYIGLCVLQGLSILLAATTIVFGSIRSSKNLHNSLIHNVLKLPMQFFESKSKGSIVNVFSRDIDIVDNMIPLTIRKCLASLFGVVAVIVVISIFTPFFVAFVIPVGFLYLLTQIFFIRTSRQVKRMESTLRSPIYSHLGETLSGYSTIRAFEAQDRFIKEAENRIDANQKLTYYSWTLNRWLAFRLEMIGVIILLITALTCVCFKNEIGPAVTGLVLTYAMQTSQGLRFLVRSLAELETNIIAIERVESLLSEKKESAEGVEVTPSWPEKGEIEFKNVELRYREELDPVLKNISFRIASGEKISIVGRSGCGKSTLGLSILRLIEPSIGQIIIDGVDISKLKLESLRNCLTIMTQDPVIFNGTIRMNLDPFDKVTDDEIWKVLKDLSLKSYIQSFPEGLFHELSRGGTTLSIGQKQLICLGRALLKNTKILLLDEVNALIDEETDKLIQQTIRNRLKSSTVITIAHRLNTIMDYDRVIVIDQGIIAEMDKPDVLLTDQDSLFYKMVQDYGIIN